MDAGGWRWQNVAKSSANENDGGRAQAAWHGKRPLDEFSVSGNPNFSLLQVTARIKSSPSPEFASNPKPEVRFITVIRAVSSI